jgi:ASC-1-like (ASCH) protein
MENNDAKSAQRTPTVHELTLNTPWFQFVKEGSKTYEGRALFSTIKRLQIGDQIRFSHHTEASFEPFCKNIKAIWKFSTFEQALKNLPLDKVLPGVRTVEEGVQIYFGYVSLGTQKLKGVCMIELEDIENGEKSFQDRGQNQ